MAGTVFVDMARTVGDGTGRGKRSRTTGVPYQDGCCIGNQDREHAVPAVTADPLALSRLPRPSLFHVERSIRSVTTAPRGYEGEGFPVRRAFAGVDLRDLDPFIHLDQMG